MQSGTATSKEEEEEKNAKAKRRLIRKNPKKKGVY